MTTNRTMLLSPSQLVDLIDDTLMELNTLLTTALTNGKKEAEGMDAHYQALFDIFWEEISANLPDFGSLCEINQYYIGIITNHSSMIKNYCQANQLKEDAIPKLKTDLFFEMISFYHLLVKQRFSLSHFVIQHHESFESWIKEELLTLDKKIDSLQTGITESEQMKAVTPLWHFFYQLPELESLKKRVPVFMQCCNEQQPAYTYLEKWYYGASPTIWHTTSNVIKQKVEALLNALDVFCSHVTSEINAVVDAQYNTNQAMDRKASKGWIAPLTSSLISWAPFWRQPLKPVMPSQTMTIEKKI